MSARVRVPVRVRLVGAAPGDPLTAERVHAAVFSAVSTALASAPLAALGATGPDDVSVADPSVTADPGHEDVLTADVLRAVLEAVRSASLSSLRSQPMHHDGAGARVAATASEPFDPSRRRRRGGRSTYVVPFFDGGEIEVPLDEGDEETIASSRPPLPSSGEVLSLAQALGVAWNWHVYRSGARWAPSALGFPGYYGLVRIDGQVRRALVWLSDVRGTIPEHAVLRGADVSYLWWPLIMLSTERAGDPQATLRHALDPTFARYELSRTGETATLTAVEAKLTTLVEHGGYPADFPLRDPGRRRAFAEALLRDEQGNLVENHQIWNLFGGQEAALSILPQTIEGTVLDGPIQFVTAAPARAGDSAAADGGGAGGSAGSGTGTGTGTGTVRGTGVTGGTGEGEQGARSRPQRGGPLGGSATGTRLWPTTGVKREQLPCGPYLAEPRAAHLVADHGLPARMNRIIAGLEMPAPTSDCGGYLGQFAINAALTVGGLAHGIGLGAVAATSMTNVTVRLDGKGNNAFLDVRPGASPEFDYLRTLAGLAREVSAFGNDVVSCYLDSRNAAQVRVDADWDPNPPAWALRFLGDFNDAMIGAYQQLYAETCRTLLLQQLRSSRQGIVGRREHSFEATLQSFTSTLDILGETVVELSTLKRAVRHSGEVHVTGTLRQVMTVPRTMRFRGEVYELPAPIGSVPARILTAVADARIERRGSQTVAVYQGRDWSVSDLDSAIGMRRSLLNRVDPLFLQVADLDTLFASAQSDPGFPRRYLSSLLTEMLRANTEMTAESSDADDGAYFALEASQYIEREGGRDWRGLEFELHGIHALADEQLRHRIGSDGRYAEGINQAIGRKANFDRFIAIFATVGIIALGLLCAPLGAVAAAAITGIAGLALTALDIVEADRKTDLYRALEDPELFLRWQEVQLAQLMAGLSVVFSVFDIVGVGKAAHAIVGTVRHGLRVGERAGARMALASIARSTRRELVRNMTREVLEQAIRQAVLEATIVAVMSQLLPQVIKPVLVPWLRQQALEHGTLREVDAALGPLAAGLPAPTRTPGGQ